MRRKSKNWIRVILWESAVKLLTEQYQYKACDEDVEDG